ncbi:hypothetical protein BDK51DRAFT_26727 [Blyttiomyces helicus]|uniref:Uncharacterized protein n=1 Tax=Blyttiomyces helicus TaxID=388810 RepID=A0A4P9WJJ0_9FUNG|nr:hypothetical protein BDK51DRAFT_26727 [Blyttiomyces helicus]|eukprot:RKO93091.1 hypothetical protein BDK51DRAFT_26727 [Blyttiomyces helicus]
MLKMQIISFLAVALLATAAIASPAPVSYGDHNCPQGHICEPLSLTFQIGGFSSLPLQKLHNHDDEVKSEEQIQKVETTRENIGRAVRRDGDTWFELALAEGRLRTATEGYLEQGSLQEMAEVYRENDVHSAYDWQFAMEKRQMTDVPLFFNHRDPTTNLGGGRHAGLGGCMIPTSYPRNGSRDDLGATAASTLSRENWIVRSGAAINQQKGIARVPSPVFPDLLPLQVEGEEKEYSEPPSATHATWWKRRDSSTPMRPAV